MLGVTTNAGALPETALRLLDTPVRIPTLLVLALGIIRPNTRRRRQREVRVYAVRHGVYHRRRSLWVRSVAGIWLNLFLAAR